MLKMGVMSIVGEVWGYKRARKLLFSHQKSLTPNQTSKIPPCDLSHAGVILSVT